MLFIQAAAGSQSQICDISLQALMNRAQIHVSVPFDLSTPVWLAPGVLLLGGPAGVCAAWQAMRKHWWKQSLSSHSKTNRLSSEACTIAQWSARQWLTLSAPLGTCFLLLCNPGACFPICAAPRQLSPILPQGKKCVGGWKLLERIPLRANSLEQLSQRSVIPQGSSCPLAPVAFRGEARPPPKKSPPVRSVTLQKSPRQAQPILALALSQISWSMLGMKTGGFPNRRPPIEANSPPPSPNQNTLRCRWLSWCQNKSAIKVHSKHIRGFVHMRRLPPFQCPEPDVAQAWRKGRRWG